jgi:hypothetical protein
VKSNKSKLLLICLFVWVIPIKGFPQRIHSGALNYLNFAFGSKGLTLGTDIRDFPKNQLSFLDGISKPDDDGCFKYQLNDSTIMNYDKLPISLVAIRTFHNKIVNIYLFFKKADGYLFLRDFLTSYGVFTSKPNDYVDIYNWDSSSINLLLNYELTDDLGEAVYTFKPLKQELLQIHYKNTITNLLFLTFNFNQDFIDLLSTFCLIGQSETKTPVGIGSNY